MSPKPSRAKKLTKQAVTDIPRGIRRYYSAEDKILSQTFRANELTNK